MGKALKAVGTAIVIIGAAVATAGAALIPAVAGGGISGALGTAVFGVTAGQLMTVGALVSSVGGSLSQPKVSNAGSALGWVGDPNGPMHFAAGRIAVGGDLRHKAAYGPDDRMYFSAVTVVSDAGPIDAFESFTANDIPVTFDASGKAITSHYANVMWRRTQLGQQPETGYLASPSGLKNGATLPNWGPSHKLSAKAGFILTLSENSKHSAYKGQYPKPRTVIRGLRVYDWRRDSTVPGGDGPCRLNDPSTWPYSANPILWSVKWLLGLWEGPTGKGSPQVDHQVGGIGARWENIDVAAFTEAANIADTHGWTCAARPSTDDDKAQVLDAFLQAGGAYYIERAGKASCIHRAAPRVSVATITAADTAGPIELDTSASYLDRKNTGVATYLSEADGWKMTALPEVTSPQWVAEDGGRKRSVPVTYSYVDRAKQASELMCLGIAHTREGISGRIPLKSYMQGIGPGSAFTIKEPEFVLDGLKCLCLETSYDANTGVHTVTFVSETDAKYPYAYGQAPNPPAPPALTPVDPTHVSPPQPGDWTIIPRPPAPGGGQLPVIDLSGIVSNATAEAMLINWREVAEGEDPTAQPPFMDEEGDLLPGWVDAGVWPPTTRTLSIQGPQPGAQIWIAIRYKRGNNVSPAELAGPITVGDLIAGGLAPESPIWGQLNDLTKQALRSAIEAAQALLDEEQRRQIEVNDILDRLGLGFLLDPVTRTALIKSETVVQGVGPGGLPETLVQMSTRLVAADAANALNTAQALITAEAKINSLRSESYAAFATYNAMGDAISASALGLRSWTTNEIAGATANLVSGAQMGTAISNSELSLRNWTNGQISQAVSGLASTAYVAGSLATAKGQWEAYADAASAASVVGLASLAHVAGSLATAKGQWEAYADDASARSVVGLDSVAAREAAVGAAVLSLQNWSDGRFATSAALLGVQSTANNASSAAALALSAANGNEAYAALTADAGGRLTAMRINGVTRAIDFLAETFNVTAEGGNGISYSAASKIFKIFGDGQKTLMKASGGVRFWSGPTSVPDGSETAENGVIALGPGVPGGGRFNGQTLSGPFDSGPGSASVIGLGTGWTTMAQTAPRLMLDGFMIVRASWKATLSTDGAPPPAFHGLLWRIATTNESGGDLRVVASGYRSGSPNLPNITMGPPFERATVTGSGQRRILLQLAIDPDDNTAAASAHSAQFDGLYAA